MPAVASASAAGVAPTFAADATPALATASGLEGVVAADTALSDVDGERGHLVIAGHDVETWAAEVRFEDATWALWHAAGMPGLPDAVTLRARLGAARVAAFARLPHLGDALAAADGMDALRAATAHLPPAGDLVADAVQLTAAVAVFAAAWARGRAGLAPLAPDPDAAHAADYLRMAQVGAAAGRPDAALVRGDAGRPDAALVRGLDTYLVTVSDHGMNASTFAARVVTSTASDPVSAIVAAIGALKGPLHGGAPGPVLDMLDAVGAPDAARAEAWLSAELSAGRRIMGMGHRIYRVRDPRAAVLERATAALEAALGHSAGRLGLARAVEHAAAAILRARRPDRPLCANVEFYTAVLLDAVGLDRSSFSPTFAVGRVAGWLAHVAEQTRTGRLIRPASRYVGAAPAAASGASPVAAPP